MNALEIALTSAEQKAREGGDALAAAQRDKASLLAVAACTMCPEHTVSSKA